MCVGEEKNPIHVVFQESWFGPHITAQQHQEIHYKKWERVLEMTGVDCAAVCVRRPRRLTTNRSEDYGGGSNKFVQ